MTPEQIREFRKCGADFTYFCQKYVKILNTEDGLVPFNLFPYQERVISNFEQHRFNIVSKFRQAGLTTVAVVYGLWKCMFSLDQRILILSKSDREAIGVGKIVEMVKNNFPDWLKPSMKNDNDHEKEFANSNSVMWFYTCEAARSKSAGFLILDEAAFIKNMDEHWKAMYPTLSNGGRCAVISTVNGIGNWYEQTYHRAKEGKNWFNVIELDYREHPKYCKPDWEKQTKANLGEKAWAQEILRQFSGSGDTFILASALDRVKQGLMPPVRKVFPEWDCTRMDDLDKSLMSNENYEKGALWEWEPPQENQEYIVVADVGNAMGGEGDSTTFQVINLNTYEQVAEFASNEIPTFDFSQVLAEMAVFYNEALVVVEDASQGATVLQLLEKKIQYTNIYYSMRGKRDKPGLVVGKNTRPMALETMRTCLTEGLVKIRSTRLFAELETFVVDRRTQKPKATKGKHDDLVMALALGLHVSDALNQEIPLMSKDQVKDVISDAILGEGLDNIRRSLEMGSFDDDDADWPDELDASDLLPRLDPQMMKLYARPNESLFKSFGF